MIVRDVLDVYQTLNYKDTIYGLWEDMSVNNSIDSRVSKPTLWATLLEECGNLIPRYNTTEEFKRFSELFFTKNNPIFTRRLNALEAEYNIVYDYDMQTIEHKDRGLEEGTDISQETTAHTDSTADNTVNSVTESESHTDTEGHSGTDHTTSAYNSSDYQPRDRNVTDSTEETDSTAKSETNTKGHDVGLVDAKGTMNQGSTHKLGEKNDLGRHEYGRKGAAQELIKQELELADEMDIYQFIADMYSRTLCLNVF